MPRNIASGLQGYVRGRVSEFAKHETRAASEPLATWAQKRVRIDGKPFSFEGHAFLRTIYDDTAPHVVLTKAAQVGGTTWAILRSIHAWIGILSGCPIDRPETEPHPQSRLQDLSPADESNEGMPNTIRDSCQFPGHTHDRS